MFGLFKKSAGTVVDGQRARELVAEGARLVDVRTPSEYAGGHIDGAINIPLNELANRAHELGDLAKPIVLYCKSGMRSAKAARQLGSIGFSQLYDLRTVDAW
jgi:rhodanese-related sulfurtransferase